MTGGNFLTKEPYDTLVMLLGAGLLGLLMVTVRRRAEVYHSCHEPLGRRLELTQQLVELLYGYGG